MYVVQCVSVVCGACLDETHREKKLAINGYVYSNRGQRAY